MRARVTLRGLLVEREPGRVEVVPWLQTHCHAQGSFVPIGPDGEQIGGWRGVLLTRHVREGRVAARLHERAMKRAFRDGTLEVRRCFRSEIRGQQFSAYMIGVLLLLALVVQVQHMGWPWTWPWWSLAFMLVPILGAWWIMTRPPFYGSRCVLRVWLTPTVLGIERRDGSREEHSFDDARRLELRGVPLIELRNGEIVRVPGLRGIRGVLTMIQRERFPEAAEREKGALHRSLIRSCVYFMIGGVAAGVLTWYLQGQGLMPASRWRPLLGGLGFGLGMPCMLVLSVVFQKWMDSGVPPWKKKAWTEIFR